MAAVNREERERIYGPSSDRRKEDTATRRTTAALKRQGPRNEQLPQARSGPGNGARFVTEVNTHAASTLLVAFFFGQTAALLWEELRLHHECAIR